MQLCATAHVVSNLKASSWANTTKFVDWQHITFCLQGLAEDDLMGYFLMTLEAHAPLLQVQCCQDSHEHISNARE